MRFSVIIPCNHSYLHLNKTVKAVIGQTYKPFELIIIDSFNNNLTDINNIKHECSKYNINFVYLKTFNLFPGAARNRGVTLSFGDIICFVDVLTIPNNNWIENSFIQLQSENVDGIYGSTFFCAKNYWSNIVRDALFGIYAKRTLPGSLFKKTVFQRSGLFIESVRAGEDTEWILRLIMLDMNIIDSKIPNLSYIGLLDLNFTQITRKWIRNYFSSRYLPNFNSQKHLVFFFIYSFTILIAFNWNSLIAGWNTNSIYYIDNITKITVITPGLIYLIIRGILMPNIRGVGIFRLFPFRFIFISFFCLYLDLIKCIILLIPKKLKIFN